MRCFVNVQLRSSFFKFSLITRGNSFRNLNTDSVRERWLGNHACLTTVVFHFVAIKVVS